MAVDRQRGKESRGAAWEPGRRKLRADPGAGTRAGSGSEELEGGGWLEER
jgi:hypothetical protein